MYLIARAMSIEPCTYSYRAVQLDRCIYRRLGSDPDSLFPYAAFEEHLKRFALYIFIMGPMMSEVMVAGAADIPDLDEMSTKLKSADDSSAGASIIGEFCEATQREYVARLEELFNDLIDMGFYWKK